MVTGLLHTHTTLAYLLLISTTLSVIVSSASFAVGPRPGLLKAGGILSRGVEMSAMGLTGLAGLGLWAGMRLPLTSWWLWLGLGAVLISSVLVARGIKPALAGLRDGQDRRGQWVGLAVGHWALVLGAVALMHAFP